MTEVPKEWKGTPEEWSAVVEAFGRIAKAIQEAGRQIVNSFSELYKRMAAAMGNEQVKKRLRQQSIRDRKKQLQYHLSHCSTTCLLYTSPSPRD